MTRGCNIGIWKKFQSRSVAALHQQNRDLQNKRLTKTIVLLFVSSITLLAWLPLVTLNFSIIVCFFRVRMKFYYMINNCQPVLYALRIPEFRRRTLAHCCFRGEPAINATLAKSRNERKGKTDFSHEPMFKQDVMDTKL